MVAERTARGSTAEGVVEFVGCAAGAVDGVAGWEVWTGSGVEASVGGETDGWMGPLLSSWSAGWVAWDASVAASPVRLTLVSVWLAGSVAER